MDRQSNAAYWARRLKKMEEALLDLSYAYVENMERQFAIAQGEVDSQIAAWYSRFAANNEITLADAKKLLRGRELAEFRWTVEEYIAYGQQNALDGDWVKKLENASARVHISRLEALKLQIQQQAERLYANQLDFVDAAARQAYTGSYYGTAFEVQRGLGVGWTMQALSEGVIEKVLSRPWTADGQTFRERCWSNKQALVNSVNTQLTQMIIRGEAPDRAIAAISKQFGVSKSKAGRLVMTESAFFASAAQKDCYGALGVERYKIVASFDQDTCGLCGALDGKVFGMPDYQEGLTAPPFHPWCRCCTCPYFEDMEELGERWARNLDGSTGRVPADMSFEEWKRRFIVQESDLGDTVRRAGKSILSGGKVVGFDGLPKDFQQAFQNGLADAAPEARKVLEREYRRADYMLISSKRSYYRRFENVVGLGTGATPSTLAHELFHKIDAGGKISMGLSEVLMKDYAALNIASGGDVKEYLMQKYVSAFSRTSKSGDPVMGEAYRGIADVLNGLSGGKIKYGFRHAPDYWTTPGMLESETWAQFGRILYENDTEVVKMLSEVFPNFCESAILALRGAI